MRSLKINYLLCVASYLMPLLAKADVSVGHHRIANENPISLPNILQIIISFIGVVAFILFLAWLMKKTGRYGSAGNNNIKIISSLSLGMREKIVLINVNNVNLVVGVAPGQIRTLHILPEATQTADTQSSSDDGFRRIIGKFLK